MNIPERGVATAIVDKAYFYDEPDENTKTPQYIKKNRIVEYSAVKGDFIFAFFTNRDYINESWMKISDFKF
jgi:hypothetical protein